MACYMSRRGGKKSGNSFGIVSLNFSNKRDTLGGGSREDSDGRAKLSEGTMAYINPDSVHSCSKSFWVRIWTHCVVGSLRKGLAC